MIVNRLKSKLFIGIVLHEHWLIRFITLKGVYVSFSFSFSKQFPSKSAGGVLAEAAIRKEETLTLRGSRFSGLGRHSRRPLRITTGIAGLSSHHHGGAARQGSARLSQEIARAQGDRWAPQGA